MILLSLLQSHSPDPSNGILFSFVTFILGIGSAFLATYLSTLWDGSRSVKFKFKEVQVQPGPRGMVSLQNFPMPNNLFFQGMIKFIIVVDNKSTKNTYMLDPRFTFYLNNRPVAGFSFSGERAQTLEMVDLPAKSEKPFQKNFEFWSSVAIEELQNAKLIFTCTVSAKGRSLIVPFNFVMVRYGN